MVISSESAILSRRGADVNAKTIPNIRSFNFYGEAITLGETPLHRAAAFASFEVISAPIEAGADRTARDDRGLCPRQWEDWYRRPNEFVDFLRE